MLARLCYKSRVPKTVDHADRRRLIARATWQVITRDGLRGATVRTVAAEAGLSPGALRHYFDDHASLLLFAARHSVELIGARIFAQLASTSAAPVDVVQGCLEQLLPLDAQRTAETAVYFGLADLARLEPEHREFREASFRTARRLYRLLVAWLAGGPAPMPAALQLAESTDDAPLLDAGLEARARLLQVVVDGLAVDGLLCPGEMDPGELRAVLRGELERIVRELRASSFR